MSNDNLYLALTSQAAGCGGKLFLNDEGGRSLHYSDLDALSGRLAQRLLDLGAVPGDRIVVQVEKSPEAVLLYLASLRAGLIFVPLNTAYMADELAYFIGDAEPAIVICRPADEQRVGAMSGASVVATLDESGGGSLWAALGEASAPVAPRKDDDVACILYTSGTTGRSKGAMLTHRNLRSNAQTLNELWGWSTNDVLLHVLPIYHVHGLFVALHGALMAGAEVLFHRGYSPDAAIAELSRATVMMGVPTHYSRLIGSGRLSRELCANVRLFISGSAPLLAQTHAEFADLTGHMILERYGMTETGMIASNPLVGDRVAGTVGYALPGVDVRIPGNPAVLEVRGPNVLKGYWRNEEKTAEAFTPDGYFITGDLAVMAPDGRVTLVGREKDLIIAGGLNIYPKEIEELIDGLEGVEESAVIGIPHQDLGEAVVAVVSLLPGADLNEDKILTLVQDRIARFKQPRRIFTVSALPRNAMGKVQKAELRRLYSDAVSSA